MTVSGDNRALRRAARRAARHWTLTTAPVFVALALVLLVAVPAARAAVEPNVTGATVLSTTSVKIVFDTDVDASGENVANYSISPSLLVTGALRSDGNQTVVLTTLPQLNASLYSVTVSGVRARGPGGQTMSQPQTVRFIGTLQGLNSTSTGHDDFNRPSGWLAADNPIAGPWDLKHQDAGNTLEAVSSPTLVAGFGDRAFKSTVTSTDGELDNAALLHGLGGGSEYYTSAYVYIPSGQGWEPGHAVGLLRFNQTEWLAHARISAFTESPTTFALKVNFKSDNNAYFGEQPVATGIGYGAWHWFQMRVKNSPADGQPGVVQVWIDGRLRYSQDSIVVARQPITYAEVGIMHNVTTPTGPPSTTVTDAVRMGTSYQLPSLVVDTTAPQVQVTSPSAGQAVRATTQVTAQASDDYDVQRVAFTLDGAPLATDDVAPFSAPLDPSALDEGLHSLAARAFDTSGNFTDSPPVAFSVDTTQATVSLGGAAPTPFSPDGDGVDDATVLSYSTSETTWQRVTVRSGATVVATPLDWVQSPAGARQVAWDGRLANGSPASQGDYSMRVEVKDLVTPELPAAQAEATVTLLATLGAVSAAPTPFSPNGDGSRELLTVGFTLNGPAAATVTVTRPDGGLVRTLLAGAALESGAHEATWDGSADDGQAGDGSYVVRVQATTAGGTQTRQVSVVLDRTAPETGDDGDAAWHNSDVTLTLTAADPVSGVALTRYRLDGDGWKTGTSVTVSAAGNGSDDGEHVVEYRSTDLAGNVEAVRTTTVRIDTTAPTATVAGADDLWHADDVTLTLAGDDGDGGGVAATEYRLDGGDWTAGAEAVVPAPDDGSNDGLHEVEYRSVDLAGNVGATKSVSVRIGHVDHRERYIRHKASTLSLSWPAVAGAESYDVLVDGQPAGTTPTTALVCRIPTDVRGVVLTVEIVARDADGNQVGLNGAQVPWR